MYFNVYLSLFLSWSSYWRKKEKTVSITSTCTDEVGILANRLDSQSPNKRSCLFNILKSKHPWCFAICKEGKLTWGKNFVFWCKSSLTFTTQKGTKLGSLTCLLKLIPDHWLSFWVPKSCPPNTTVKQNKIYERLSDLPSKNSIFWSITTLTNYAV